MPTETLHIQNFAGIKDAEISLARFNLFIGPQASGKSVTAKLFYYFKRMIESVCFAPFPNLSAEGFMHYYRNDFSKYFPPISGGTETAQIQYSCGDYWIKVAQVHNATQWDFSYSGYLDDLLNLGFGSINEYTENRYAHEEDSVTHIRIARQLRMKKVREELSPFLTIPNSFIPAGRSFFSTIQENVFSLWNRDFYIDPFVKQLGITYAHLRRDYHELRTNDLIAPLLPYVAKIIRGTYVRENDQDFIRSSDGRQVPLSFCSSGQQEALPLALVLATSTDEGATLFVEEPEAHLYPSTQRDIIHLLATAANQSATASEGSSSQYLITTHSPYILSALNNLMYAGQIAEKFPERSAQVAQVIDDAAPIAPGQVQAYLMQDGTAQSIIDPETGLIRATMLDEVSGELAQEFDQLMDIEFTEE